MLNSTGRGGSPASLKLDELVVLKDVCRDMIILKNVISAYDSGRRNCQRQYPKGLQDAHGNVIFDSFSYKWDSLDNINKEHLIKRLYQQLKVQVKKEKLEALKLEALKKVQKAAEKPALIEAQRQVAQAKKLVLDAEAEAEAA